MVKVVYRRIPDHLIIKNRLSAGADVAKDFVGRHLPICVSDADVRAALQSRLLVKARLLLGRYLRDLDRNDDLFVYNFSRNIRPQGRLHLLRSHVCDLGLYLMGVAHANDPELLRLVEPKQHNTAARSISKRR